MDERIRYITKISRNLELYKRSKKNSCNFNSSTELVLHVIRHNKGITQDGVSTTLSLDKALITRIIKNLIEDGLVYKERSEVDKRAYKLYPTTKAEEIKDEIVNIEEVYYNNIINVLNKEEKEEFLSLLERVYFRSKQIRKNNNETL